MDAEGAGPVIFGANLCGSLDGALGTADGGLLGTVLAAASAAIAAAVAVAVAVSVAVVVGAACTFKTGGAEVPTGGAPSSCLIEWCVMRRPSSVGIVLMEARRFCSCGVKVAATSGVT